MSRLSSVARPELWRPQNLWLPGFISALDGYGNQFKGVGSLSEHIMRLKARIKNAASANAQAGHVGVIVSTGGRVEIFKNGRWTAVPSGYRLNVTDRLRTGPRGVAQIDFLGRAPRDHNRQLKAATGTIAPYTTVTMQRFAAQTGVPTNKPLAPDFVVRLEAGLMRILTRIRGARVRVVPSGAMARGPSSGQTSVVSRGTEGSVSVDPKSGMVKAVLAHGDGYIQSGNRRVVLAPATSRTLSGGRIGPARQVTRAQWTKIAARTGVRRDQYGAAAKFGTGPRRVTNTRVRPGTRENRRVPKDAQARRMTRLYADSVVNGMLFAVRNYDVRTVLDGTTGKFRTGLQRGIQKKRSFKALLDPTGDRPVSHAIRCTSCQANGEKCQVLVDVGRAGNRPGTTTPQIFSVRIAERGAGPEPDFKVNNASRPDSAAIKAFMARGAICGR
jgi:hypothetical protein